MVIQSPRLVALGRTFSSHGHGDECAGIMILLVIILGRQLDCRDFKLSLASSVFGPGSFQ